jgi:hypothetical protein
MTDNEKDSIIVKVAAILGETETRIKWDMSLQEQIVKLVEAFENMKKVEVIRIKNGVETVLHVNGVRYVLDHKQYKGGK